MMNKRGFTAIELILSISFGTFILLAVIGIPNMLFSQIRNYQLMESQQFTVQNMMVSMKKDIDESGGKIRYDGEYLILKNAVYSFTDIGVYREKNGQVLRISSIPLKLDFYSDAFALSTLNPGEDNFISLRFNKRSSSFDNGGIINE